MVTKAKTQQNTGRKIENAEKIREIVTRLHLIPGKSVPNSGKSVPNSGKSVPIPGKVSRIPGNMSSDFFSANIEIVLQDGNIVALRTDQGTALVAFA